MQLLYPLCHIDILSLENRLLLDLCMRCVPDIQPLLLEHFIFKISNLKRVPILHQHFLMLLVSLRYLIIEIPLRILDGVIPTVFLFE